MRENFFTMQIETGTHGVIELKDLTKEDVIQKKTTIYTQGISVETSPGVAWEHVSPFHIKTVRFLLQDKKYSLV